MSGVLAAAAMGVPSPVSAEPFNVFDFQISPNDAYAEISVDNDGNVYKTTNGGGTVLLFQWRRSGASADFDVKATVLSGDTPSGSALGSFLNCGTDRSWALDETFNGYGQKECVLQLEWSRAGIPTPVLATTSGQLRATVEV